MTIFNQEVGDACVLPLIFWDRAHLSKAWTACTRSVPLSKVVGPKYMYLYPNCFTPPIIVGDIKSTINYGYPFSPEIA